MNKNRNKLMFLLLILVIFGTMLYCYDFSTSRVNKANLIIKTGKLSIKTHNDDKWVLLNKNSISEIKYENYKNSFVNAKPGDVFIKKIIIENTGTLKQQLTFEVNEKLPDIVKEMFDIEITGIENEKNFLEPNDTRNVTIKLALKNKFINNNLQNKNVDFYQLEVSNFLIVRGNQIKI